MSIGCIVALVLGVVGFVVLFLVPARPAILGIGERPLRARSEMQNIVLAVKAYQTEYSRIPALESPPPTKDNTEGYDTSNEQGRGLIEILTGTDDSKNPRQITFYEPPAHKKNGGGYTKENGLVDIWGTKGYIILLDYDGDGKVADPEHPGATVNASASIYSAGPDQDYNTWKDNVKSWEP